MKETETSIVKCLTDIGQDIVGDEYLLSLIKGKKKFEGWVQIELARRLKMTIPEVFKEVHCEYKIPLANFYADIFLTNSNTERVYLEVKFIVISRAVNDSRDSLRKQLSDNNNFGLSYGVAVLVSHLGDKWFKQEIKKIEKGLPIKLVKTAFSHQYFSIILFKSELTVVTF